MAQQGTSTRLNADNLTTVDHDAFGPEGATDPGGAAAVRAAAVLRRAVHGLQRDLQVLRRIQNGQ